jgi:hypothetical protein
MNELDRDTEAQIEKLVDDFRSKIVRIVVKNSSKLLKEQSRQFKEQSKNTSSSPRKLQTSSRPSSTTLSKGRRRDYDTDDSD